MKITTFKYIGKLMITFIPKEDKTNVYSVGIIMFNMRQYSNFDENDYMMAIFLITQCIVGM